MYFNRLSIFVRLTTFSTPRLLASKILCRLTRSSLAYLFAAKLSEAEF